MKRIEKHPILPAEDREKVAFTYNGVVMYGYEGEPVSSALIANGIKTFAVHERGDAPQGIYCANGQCGHCTLIIDGFPLKSCVTPLKPGIDVRVMRHRPELPADDRPLRHYEKKEISCDVLVVGGGPSGLTAAIELAKLDFSVLLIDDKENLGGKLLLQTHKFFGSIADCYAGTRGVDIAVLLEKELRSYENATILTDTSVAAIYKDRRAGLFIRNKNYAIVDFEGMIVSAGAREKSLIFPGNQLPGVYGAGAFQTLVNRDLIKSSDRVFIVGSGNVGLIAAYHALQAGIDAVGICEILDSASGYKVHVDKIKRMGTPIYLGHTIVSAEGDSKVERVTIARIDKNFQPLLETAKTFEVDTLLIAVGLSPVDEFYDMAKKFGFTVMKAGDANEIAEASSAMFGGKIAGLKMAKKMGKEVRIDNSFSEKAKILKSRPGQIFPSQEIVLTKNFRPIIFCNEEIPCNPCTSVCPVDSIRLNPKLGNIMDIPIFENECTGCQKCVLICPGLAITLARKIDDQWAEVLIPHEFIPDFEVGEKIPLMSQEGDFLEMGETLKIQYNKKHKTRLIRVRASLKNATKIAGIQVQRPSGAHPLPEPNFDYAPDHSTVCQCEMVPVKEIVDYIKKHHVSDVNQLKKIRVGMGACGGKTCSILLPRVFGMAGVNWSEVAHGTKRPLSVEVPMYAIINEKQGE